MRTKQIKILEQLLKIPSPSGHEQKIAKYIYDELATFMPKKQLELDFHNNVIVTIKGKTKKKLMIDAHTDEVGFSVCNVDNRGLISLKYIGWTDRAVLTSKDLVILTNKGKVNAVVDRKHSHLVDDEEDEVFDKISEAQIDIGIRGRKQVLKQINIGDPVIYRPAFNLLTNDKHQGAFISGRGFDDKAGCLILIEAIREIVKTKKKPVCDLIFVFSWGEEIGYKGATECVNRYKPDLFLEVDVGFASDYLDDELEKEVGRCHLGKGIIIMRGTNIDPKGEKLLQIIARKNQIKIQIISTDASVSYTSEHLSTENGGIRALTLAIPLRNMHNPTEIINMKDINFGTNLLKHFVYNKNLKGIFE